MIVYKPEIVRDRVLAYADRPEPQEFGNKAQYSVRMAYINAINRIPGMIDADEARYLVWGWVLSKPEAPLKSKHSKDLTPQMWNALGKWATELHDGEYRQRPSFEAELSWVLTRARYDYNKSLETQGQLTMEQLISDWQANVKAMPDQIEMDDRGRELPDMLEAALELGGIPAICDTLPEQYAAKRKVITQLPKSEIYWCDWCGEYPSSPGVPCNICEILGEKPEDRAKSQETKSDIDPALL